METLLDYAKFYMYEEEVFSKMVELDEVRAEQIRRTYYEDNESKIFICKVVEPDYHGRLEGIEGALICEEDTTGRGNAYPLYS